MGNRAGGGAWRSGRSPDAQLPGLCRHLVRDHSGWWCGSAPQHQSAWGWPCTLHTGGGANSSHRCGRDDGQSARHHAAASKRAAMLGAWPVSRSWNQAVNSDHAAVACSTVSRRRPAASDTALLIYTSGTTGLPKAAIVTHGRLVEWSCWFAAVMDVTPADRLYDCLPMYHSTGGVVAIGAMLVKGGSVMIARRFSVSRVLGRCGGWRLHDCRLHWRTVPLPGAQPDASRELQHRLRLVCGNGLRADIWQQFQQRFGIPHPRNSMRQPRATSRSTTGKRSPVQSAVCRNSLHTASLSHLSAAIVETGEAHRGADGFCIRCAPDEIGEAIGQIAGPDAPHTRHFDGYTDVEATASKGCTMSLCRGIAGFHGRPDAQGPPGYYYFIDRIGDTFRWKGENVSTTEVSAVLAACPGVTEAVVYGVAIPGNEGRAGMAAVTVKADFDSLCCTATSSRACLTMRAPLPARVRTPRGDGHVQAAEGAAHAGRYSNSVAPDPVWFYDRSRGAFIVCHDNCVGPSTQARCEACRGPSSRVAGIYSHDGSRDVARPLAEQEIDRVGDIARPGPSVATRCGARSVRAARLSGHASCRCR